MTTPSINVMAVKNAALRDSQWAQHILVAYKSLALKTAILSNRFCDRFTPPDYLK